MEQVIPGGFNDLLHTTNTEYSIVAGGRSWGSVDGRGQAVSTGGKLKNLRVELGDVPVTGTYTFTLHRRVGLGAWANTALTCTVLAAGTTASDMVNEVAVAAGDIIALECNPDAPDNARYVKWTMVFEGDNAKESLLLFNAITSNASTIYCRPMGEEGDTTENDVRCVCPTSGKIKNLYVQLDIDPGTAPDALRFTLRKGGASQTLTCTITADGRTGNDTEHEITVAAGDILTLMIEPLSPPQGASPKAAIGMTFVADTDGESLILGGAEDNLHNTNTEYHSLISFTDELWTATEPQKYQLSQECVLKKLYVLLSGAPDAGNKYTFTVRQNAASPANGLVVEIADAATTGNDVAHTITLANDDELTMQVIPNDTPTVRDAYWGLVGFIETIQHYERSASVIIGNLVSATRSPLTTTRASSIISGVVATASRVFGRTRASAVIAGIVASTVLRSWGRIRASSVLVGNLVTATRGLGTFTRASSVLIGNLVTAVRNITTTKPTASVIIGILAATTTRVLTMTRASSTIVGVKVTTKRTYLSFTRASSVLIGNLVTAKVQTGVYRAIVYIGIVITASRWIPKTFTSAVTTGIVVTATKRVATAVASAVIVGVTASAVIRMWGRFRTSAVIVGAVSTASRVVAYYRSVAAVTFYSDADPESTSVDGVVQQVLAFPYGSWAQIRDGDGNVFNDTIGAYSLAGVYSGLNTNEWWRIYRSIFLFDISALPPGVTIIAVALTLYGEGKANDLGDPAINVYSANPASNTGLVGTDYSTLGLTPLATQINYAGWIGSFDEEDPQPNVFTLNAAGIAVAQAATGGILKLGVREVNFDVGNSAPGWQANKVSRFQGYFADQAALLVPKLIVTYTSPTLFPPTIISITVSATRALTFTRQATTRVGAVITAFGLRIGRLLKMVVFGRSYYDMTVYTKPQFDMEVSNDIR